MTAPNSFEIVGERGYFRPSGIHSLDEAVALVDEAILYARSQHLRQLLVNLLGVDGIPPPNIVERYGFVEKWANLAGGVVQLAMVVAHELIDGKKFGVMVASNRGFAAEVFSSEAEGMAWLDKSADARRTGPPTRPA